jgi:energy-converting hydrogenase Eha subunit A
MKTSLNEKLIAYLVLLSGLAISAVAEYYSIMGLIAIYPAAVIPIIIMGVVLGLGKISGTIWLKQNWEWSPFFLKAYVLPAIIALMLITSLGVFGFLSKAHSDQSLVSGDVQSKIAVYDEKIKTAKENIDANRKALKQMDEAVDQVMGRSNDEKGADKAVQIRRAQLKERQRLQSEIQTEQKTISVLTEERAPIAAEVRQVEAEVGPIKYIAHLLYGENPDANILEKAVIWVTVLIVIVLDPLAVVLLLASQYSFQRFRELEAETAPAPVTDVGEKPTVDKTPIEEDNFFLPTYEEITPGASTTASTANIVDDALAVITPNNTATTVSYQFLDEVHEEEIPHVVDDSPNFEGIKDPNTGEWVQTGPAFTEPKPVDLYDDKGIDWNNLPPGQEYITIDGSRMHVKAAKEMYGPKHIRVADTYVQNEEQKDSGLWNKVISEQEYRDKLEKNKNEPTPNTNNPT